jgi:DNA polymerase alpha-associated DNA helicase A
MHVKRTQLTFCRMNQTMEKLQKMTEAEYSSFIRVLFGLSSPSPVASDLSAHSDLKNIEWFDPLLNESQKDAIRFALASREIALIHGPPGVSNLSHTDHSRPSILTDSDRKNTHTYRTHFAACQT